MLRNDMDVRGCTVQDILTSVTKVYCPDRFNVFSVTKWYGALDFRERSVT